ncbi:MAG TPA: hypothetical protein VGN80_10660 [Devosiaceae bacterium]|jgi:hypothetical protein|nr:hypothetical protein [Devosiaceae bacterium]
MRFILTIATVLSLAGGAMAQSDQIVIDGFVLPPEDAPRARSYCNSLAAASRSSLIDDSGAELVEPSPDPASSFSQGANSMDNALTQFDLNRLTVAKCRAAGLL